MNKSGIEALFDSPVEMRVELRIMGERSQYLYISPGRFTLDFNLDWVMQRCHRSPEDTSVKTRGTEVIKIQRKNTNGNNVRVLSPACRLNGIVA